MLAIGGSAWHWIEMTRNQCRASFLGHIRSDMSDKIVLRHQAGRGRTMKIFISWSGEKARRTAIALKAFLQDVNQGWIPWFSDTDILAGQRWAVELATELDTTEYGIVCVTQESLQSPWPMFEAGALSKSVKGSRLCPYLIDLTRSQLVGPLSHFQAKEATNPNTWEMLQSINLSMPNGSLPDARLRKYFDLFWPTLERELEEVNRELQPLPQALWQKLLDTLPKLFYHVTQIEMLAAHSLPIWEINLNQAAIHVWREVIQLAVRNKKLEELLQTIVTVYGIYPQVEELNAEVRKWLLSLKTRHDQSPQNASE